MSIEEMIADEVADRLELIHTHGVEEFSYEMDIDGRMVSVRGCVEYGKEYVEALDYFYTSLVVVTICGIDGLKADVIRIKKHLERILYG